MNLSFYAWQWQNESSRWREKHYIDKNIFASSLVLKCSSSFTELNKIEKTVHHFNSITHPRSCCSGHREPKVLLFQKAEQQPEGLSGTRAEGNDTEHIDRPVSREPECKWSFLVFWQELLEQVARVWHSSLMGWIPIPQLLKDQALYPGLWTSLFRLTHGFQNLHTHNIFSISLLFTGYTLELCMYVQLSSCYK